MAEKKEAQNEGHFTLLESLLMIIHFILHGLDVTAQNLLNAKIRHLCYCCSSIEFPLANRTVRERGACAAPRGERVA